MRSDVHRALSACLSLLVAAVFAGCQPTTVDAVGTAEAPTESLRGPQASERAEPGTPPEAGARAVLGDAGQGGDGTPLHAKPGHALAAFAAGCFWGVEDGFRQLPGVTATSVGYAGGHVEHPTYERVCDHDTGHAETVLVEFDPKVIPYEKLLRAFLQIHDPTQVDRQGPDVGDQYRSEIFTFDDAQARAAREALERAQKSADAPIATKIEPMPTYWKAEDYHQQYSEKNGYHGCPTGKLDGLL